MKTSALHSSISLLKRLALCALLSASVAQLRATNYTWTGGGSATDPSWNNSANWSGNAVPPSPVPFSGQNADGGIIFNNSPASLSSTVPSGWKVGRLVFNSGSGNFVLSGGTLALAETQTGGSNGNIDGTASPSTVITIGNNLIMVANGTAGGSNNRQAIIVPYILNLGGILSITNATTPQFTLRGTGHINFFGGFQYPSVGSQQAAITDGVTVGLYTTNIVCPQWLLNYGTVQLWTNNAFYTGGTLARINFNQAIAVGQTATLDLNNFNQTLAAAINNTTANNNQFIQTGTGAGGTLTVQDNSQTYTWPANGLAVIGNGQFVKNGTGLMTINSFNNSVKTFTVSNGVVTVGTGTINGQTLNVNGGTNAINNSGSISSTTLNVNNGGTLLPSAGTISSATLNVNSGGKVIASGSPALTSPLINVFSGSTFDVSGVAGGYAIANQTLSGNGAVTGTVTASSNSKINPGGVGAIGALTLNDDLVATGGAVQIDMTNAPVAACDNLVINGNLSLNTTLYVSLNFLSPTMPAGTYTLMAYSGMSGAGSVQFDQPYPNITLDVGANATRMTIGPGGSSSLIIVQPNVTNEFLYVGGSAGLSVSASGAAPLAYQWNFNGAPIAGATTTGYALSNAQLTNAGNYTCRVTNFLGAATSSVIAVTVLATPAAPYPAAVLADRAISYWRLNEPYDAGNPSANGTMAHDYLSGNNGLYNNALLGQPGYSASGSEPAEPAAAFGSPAGQTANSFVGGIPLDFATNANAEFSVEVWVNGGSQAPNAGIFGKGPFAGEEFYLDCGSTNSGAFRFFVRTAQTGTPIYSANGTAVPDGTWHHLVAVCDQASSNLFLYVDGKLNAKASGVTGGIRASANAFMNLGARQSGAADYDLQFNGSMSEAAIYGYALNASQVLSDYYAAGIAPTLVQQPTTTLVQGQNSLVTLAANGSITAGENSSVTLSGAQAAGTPPLSYQWTLNGNAVVGQTNPTLTLNNLQSGQAGAYVLVVTNAYGSANSLGNMLTVVPGTPQLVADVQPLAVMQFVGQAFTLMVDAQGTEPVLYQWQLNGANLADGGRITGAHSNVLTVADALVSDTGSYQVLVTNTSGGIASALASVTVTPIGFDSGANWQLNNGATMVSNVLTLTDGSGSENRSSFVDYPQYIGGFQASWIYQDIGGGGADGMVFVLQNSAAGLAALGAPGGALGYWAIAPSVGLEFNIYSGSRGGVGIAFGTNGATAQDGGGSPYASTLPVNIASGNPINVALRYAGGIMSLTLTDSVAGTTFSLNLAADLPSILGANTAYVGFTGASGGSPSHQQVSDFTFVSLPQLSLQLTGANTALLSWPSTAGGFVLQQNADLSTANWVTVAQPVNQANGQNQVVVPAPDGPLFFRLVVP
jgi:hypothetical protein